MDIETACRTVYEGSGSWLRNFLVSAEGNLLSASLMPPLLAMEGDQHWCVNRDRQFVLVATRRTEDGK
jgi:hypothetical protein